jgi:alanine racemase
VQLDREAATQGKKVSLHLKVDTGMGRLGVPPQQVLDFFVQASTLKHVVIEGIFSHLANADQGDLADALQQERSFLRVVQQLDAAGYRPLPHLWNSAAALSFPPSTTVLSASASDIPVPYAFARVGIGLYGYAPSAVLRPSARPLTPLLTWKSRIIFLKNPPTGTRLGYGGTHRTVGERWIATIPVGYADGFPRALSNHGAVLVKGRRVAVVGTISMDQLLVDVTEVMPVSVGEEVVVYGKQGKEQISVEEVADRLGTIPYEMLTRLHARIPRFYLEKGKVVYFSNRLCPSQDPVD